jgi:hypothetical protein
MNPFRIVSSLTAIRTDRLLNVYASSATATQTCLARKLVKFLDLSEYCVLSRGGGAIN